MSLSSQKYWFGIRDPRFGIRKKPIPDIGSGVKKAPDHGPRVEKALEPESGSATLYEF
jgi:hypothetical protein